MMIQAAISFLMQISSVVVFVCAMSVINHMTSQTNHLFRLAYSLIATSALAGALGPLLTDWVPTVMCSAGMLGVAILFAVERRRATVHSMKSASIHVLHDHHQQQHGRAR